MSSIAPSSTDAPAANGVIAHETVIVPGVADATVTLELAADHTIWVTRPAAWAGGIRVPAERYRWLGNAPSPAKPGVPAAGGYTADDQAWREPVLAVVKSHAPNARETPEAREMAKQAWADLWSRFTAHLNPRAARLAVQYEYRAPLYAVLASRPELADYLDTCPVLGPFLTVESAATIPERGWSLQQVAQHLIAPSGEPLAPGFMAWAKRLVWEPKALPAFPRAAEHRVAAQKAFIRMAARVGGSIDPNGVQKLTLLAGPNAPTLKKAERTQAEDEWLLVNMALTNPVTAPLVSKILDNPASSANAVAKYFPPQMKMDRYTRIDRVFADVLAWMREDAAKPEKEQRAKGVGGFKKLTELGRKWDQEMRKAEYEQEQSLAEFRAEKEARTNDEMRQALERRREWAAQQPWGQYRLAADIDPLRPFPSQPKVQGLEEEGYVLIFHSNAAALQEETELMGHCVVTHARRCVAGEEYVFSCRLAENRKLPVATIALDSEGRFLECYGPGNKPLEDRRLDRWVREAAKRLYRTVQGSAELAAAEAPMPAEPAEPAAPVRGR